MNYSCITMKFGDTFVCIFSIRKPQGPTATFVSRDVVAVTLNISIKAINLFHAVCGFLMFISKGRLIVRSTESLNKAAHKQLWVRQRNNSSPPLLMLMPQHVSVNSCFSQVNSLRQYTTVCHLMMVVWPKRVVAFTSEEEEKNCCVDGPISAFLIIYTQQEA
jgi:hypothetical protein